MKSNQTVDKKHQWLHLTELFPSSFCYCSLIINIIHQPLALSSSLHVHSRKFFLEKAIYGP